MCDSLQNTCGETLPLRITGIERLSDGKSANCNLLAGHSGPHQAKMPNGVEIAWEPAGRCASGDCQPGVCKCCNFWEIPKPQTQKKG